jgi:hypothetical protein
VSNHDHIQNNEHKRKYWDWVYDEYEGEWRLPYPHIYTHPSLPGYWIARASDGKVYMVSNSQYAWHGRKEYIGEPYGLQRIDADAAREIVHRIGGSYTALSPEELPYVLAD